MQLISLQKKNPSYSYKAHCVIPYFFSALYFCPYNGAKWCDNVLARYFIVAVMSHKITQGCASGACLYPVSHKLIFWLQGPWTKGHIWRCTSCPALLAGEALHSLCHTNCSAVAAGLQHTARQAANTHCRCIPPELPPLGGTWDHFKASPGLRRLNTITEQLMSLTHETEGSTDEKKEINPMNIRAGSNACPLAFPLLFPPRGLCVYQPCSEHWQSQCKYSCQNFPLNDEKYLRVLRCLVLGFFRV